MTMSQNKNKTWQMLRKLHIYQAWIEIAKELYSNITAKIKSLINPKD